jgi:3-hydroxybutyryl-CoA dehydrogenase
MIQKAVICGAGTMGSGIAQAAAMAGIHTVLYDINGAVLDQARHGIAAGLDLLVKKGKMAAQDTEDTLSRIRFTEDIRDCTGEVVIEAVAEELKIKSALFRQLASINPASTIFASNTSSLSIAAIAEQVPVPERVCGMHFFNPATVMKLVEVVATPETEARVTQAILSLVRQMGKTPVCCSDSPGFIVNRVARHYYLEPLRLLGADACSAADLDRLLESAGFRMGPFRLMDLIGNDVNLAVSRSLYEASGKAPRFKPSPIQEGKVASGELGRKTGRGYYTYGGAD